MQDERAETPRRSQPARRHFYRLGGLVVRVDLDEALAQGPWWEWADSMFFEIPPQGQWDIQMKLQSAPWGETMDHLEEPLSPTKWSWRDEKVEIHREGMWTAEVDFADPVVVRVSGLVLQGLGWLGQKILGVIVPLVLDRRRRAVLFHAAAIEKDGQAVVIVAQSGVGKSTAASMRPEGTGVIGDETVLLARQSDGWWVWPGPFSKPFEAPSHGPARVVQIVELVRTGRDRLIPKHTPEAVADLLEHVRVLTPRVLDSLSALVSEVPAFTLERADGPGFWQLLWPNGPIPERAENERRTGGDDMAGESGSKVFFKPGLSIRRVGDELFILDRDSRKLHRISGAGVDFWHLMQEGLSDEEIVARIIEEYEVDRERVVEDLAAFREELRQVGLVDRAE